MNFSMRAFLPIERSLDVFKPDICDNCYIGEGHHLQVCGGCRRIALCSRACMKALWPSHK